VLGFFVFVLSLCGGKGVSSLGIFCWVLLNDNPNGWGGPGKGMQGKGETEVENAEGEDKKGKRQNEKGKQKKQRGSNCQINRKSTRFGERPPGPSQVSGGG